MKLRSNSSPKIELVCLTRSFSILVVGKIGVFFGGGGAPPPQPHFLGVDRRRRGNFGDLEEDIFF